MRLHYTLNLTITVLTLVTIFTTPASSLELVEQKRRRATIVHSDLEVLPEGTLSCLQHQKRSTRLIPKIQHSDSGKLMTLRKALRLEKRRLKRLGLSKREIRQSMKSTPKMRILRKLCTTLLSEEHDEPPTSPQNGRTLPTTCTMADLNNDSLINVFDIFQFLKQWKSSQFSSVLDLNNDGSVNADDLFLLISLFGSVDECSNDTDSPDDNHIGDGDDDDSKGDDDSSGPAIDYSVFDITPPYNPDIDCGDVPGSKTYYFSNTGNDAWSGLLPVANAERTDGPKKSLGNVGHVLRNLAQPGDCVLLRRGETWQDHQTGGTAISLGSVHGEVNAPIILGAYGDLDDSLPTIDYGGTGTIVAVSGSSKYILIRDLKLTTTAPRGSRPKGIGVIQCAGDSRPENIVFDGLIIEHLSYGATIQSNHITLKNSRLSGNYKIYPEEQDMGHTQGLYVGRQCGGGSNIHVVNNIFESNGARQTWFDWNAYVSCTDCVFVGNHLSNPLRDWEPTAADGNGAWVEAGSSGLKLRKPKNMLISDNIIEDISKVGISVGSDGGSFVGENVLIERNIIRRTVDGITVKPQSSGAGLMRNLLIRNNLLYNNLPRAGSDYPGYIFVASKDHALTRIENNTLYNIQYKAGISVNNNSAALDGSVVVAIQSNIVHMLDRDMAALRFKGDLEPTLLDYNIFDTDNFVRFDGPPRLLFNTRDEARVVFPALEPHGQQTSAGLELQNSLLGPLPRLTSTSAAHSSGLCFDDITEDFFRLQRPTSLCSVGAEE